jgi:hypothetical protein
MRTANVTLQREASFPETMTQRNGLISRKFKPQRIQIMKTKFYWLALMLSAALSAPAHAGNHNGGGGGNFAPARPAPARGSASASSFRSMPIRNFGGNRMIYSGQRFSSVGMRSRPASFRQHYVSPSGGTAQFTTGTFNRGNGVARVHNREIRGITNQEGRRIGANQNELGGNRLSRLGNNRENHGRQLANANGRGESRRNHVIAQHSGDWHRDWDRRRDHWWNGHRCHFANGSWFIYDIGFYPYDYWYPYDYYGYGSYPYGYDPGVYDPGVYEGTDAGDYDQGTYDSSNQSNDSTVAAVQEQLARQGYYRGQVDGVVGPETRRAILRFQSEHGLRATGYPTNDTLDALGLQRVASNE